MILLVIYGYMEDEVYKYKNLEALFEHWEVNNLKEFTKLFRNDVFSIYKVSNTFYYHNPYKKDTIC